MFQRDLEEGEERRNIRAEIAENAKARRGDFMIHANDSFSLRPLRPLRTQREPCSPTARGEVELIRAEIAEAAEARRGMPCLGGFVTHPIGAMQRHELAT